MCAARHHGPVMNMHNNRSHWEVRWLKATKSSTSHYLTTYYFSKARIFPTRRLIVELSLAGPLHPRGGRISYWRLARLQLARLARGGKCSGRLRKDLEQQILFFLALLVMKLFSISRFLILSLLCLMWIFAFDSSCRCKGWCFPIMT